MTTNRSPKKLNVQLREEHTITNEQLNEEILEELKDRLQRRNFATFSGVEERVGGTPEERAKFDSETINKISRELNIEFPYIQWFFNFFRYDSFTGPVITSRPNQSKCRFLSSTV